MPSAEPEPPAAQPPFRLLLGLIVGIFSLAAVRQELRDVDLYWHIRAGAELLSGTSVDEIGKAWTFAPAPLPWTTTQWLSEILLHQIQQSLGWQGLVVYRTVTSLLALFFLARSTLVGRPAVLAAFPFFFAATVVIRVSQERPNQVTLLAAAALGCTLIPALTSGRLPRWWVLLPLTWLWANFHGGWILAPATLVLIGLGRLVDHGAGDPAARRANLLALGALIVGTLTPAGLNSTLATIRFSRASEFIQEWMRTTPLGGLGYTAAALVLTLVLAWSRYRVPRSEVLVGISLIVFSWTAIRNIAPAVVMLAPLAAHALCEAFPTIGRGREPIWSAPVGLALAIGVPLAGLALTVGSDPLPHDKYPVRLATQIGELPGPQRVLNHYNVAGFVLAFADPEDRVGIDGRSDRYTPEYIDAYLQAQDLRGDWRQLLADLDPTSALLKKESAMAQVLVSEFGWTVEGTEGEWVLVVDGN